MHPSRFPSTIVMAVELAIVCSMQFTTDEEESRLDDVANLVSLQLGLIVLNQG